MAGLDQRKTFLEIGCYEGRSTCWTLQNGLDVGGTIYCVDSYDGMQDVHDRFWDNVREVMDKRMVVLVRDTSYNAMASMITQKKEFDFIYVDGEHAPDVALTDVCMAWGLLKQGGIMLCDDYEYDIKPTKIGLDGFLQAFKGKYDLVLQNYQLAVRKKWTHTT